MANKTLTLTLTPDPRRKPHYHSTQKPERTLGKSQDDSDVRHSKNKCQQVAPVDAKTYAPFCAFASLIIAQKASPVMAQLSKALNINSKMLKFTDIKLKYFVYISFPLGLTAYAISYYYGEYERQCEIQCTESGAVGYRYNMPYFSRSISRKERCSCLYGVNKTIRSNTN